MVWSLCFLGRVATASSLPRLLDIVPSPSSTRARPDDGNNPERHDTDHGSKVCIIRTRVRNRAIRPAHDSILQWAAVEWDGPVTFDAGDRTFTVELNDAVFGLGAFRLGTDPAWIHATITQTSSTAVPDATSTFALFGIALTGLAVVRRRA